MLMRTTLETRKLTQKQHEKRTGLDVTDDTTNRAKLTDSLSSRSSSHCPQSVIAPNLHDSFGETGDPVTRESVAKKARVDADRMSLQLRYSQPPSWKSIEHWRSQTRLCTAGETRKT